MLAKDTRNLQDIDLDDISRLMAGSRKRSTRYAVQWKREGRHTTALLCDTSQPVRRIFVKCRGRSPLLGALSLSGELAVRDALRGAANTPLIPKILYSDDSMIVFEAVPNANTLQELVAIGKATPELAVGCAKELAKLHSHQITRIQEQVRRLSSPVPTYDRVTPDDIATNLGLNERFLRLVGISDQLGQALQWARTSWTPSTLIHGDFQMSNLLVNVQNVQKISVVDWELSGLGDPHWDVGTMVGSLYYASLIDNKSPPTNWINVFINSYSEASKEYISLEKIFAYAAAWLVFKTQVNVAFSTRPSKLDVRAVYIAASMVERHDVD